MTRRVLVSGSVRKSINKPFLMPAVWFLRAKARLHSLLSAAAAMVVVTIWQPQTNSKSCCVRFKEKWILSEESRPNGKNLPIVSRPCKPAERSRSYRKMIKNRPRLSRVCLRRIQNELEPTETPRPKWVRALRQRKRRLQRTMNRRTLMIGAAGILSVAGTFLYALIQKGGPQKIAERQSEVVRDAGKVTEPMTSSIRNFNPVLSKPTKSNGTPRKVSLARVPDPGATPNAPITTSISIFAAGPQGERPLARGPKGDYAPAFRLVKCQLVNTVDSSNLTTPIIGLVTEDLCWNGKVILRADSEGHGIASVDRVRERIASEGEFTFVLNEPDRRGL